MRSLKRAIKGPKMKAPNTHSGSMVGGMEKLGKAPMKPGPGLAKVPKVVRTPAHTS